MKVSLVIGTVGRESEVARMLASVSTQTSADFEIILIDQNKDERLVRLVEAARIDGISIQHERMEVTNLSAARNRGIDIARYEVVGFPDDDCWYEPDVIAQVKREFEASTDVDGVVGCWIERGDVGCGAGRQLSLEGWRQFRDGYASSITLFFRRRLFDRIGGFDERLGVGSWFGAAEETDFILRALEEGAVIRRTGTVRVHHPFPAPSLRLAAACESARRRARGTGAIYAKHSLSPYVMARGFVAPVMRPLLRPRDARGALQGFFIALGRLEGFLRWRLSPQKGKGLL
jgi:glycosyltransferase involved in cell wall biosynthesis